MKENWKPVVGFEGLYDVSDRGQVRRACATHKSQKGHILTSGNSNGYRNLTLYDEGKRTTRNVHVLVAAAFLGPRPEGLDINHKDGIRHHNALSNLEYVTRSENKRHGFKIGISSRPQGSQNGMAKLTESDVRKMRKLWSQRPSKRLLPSHPLSRDSIAKQFGVVGSLVSMVVHRKIWAHLED